MDGAVTFRAAIAPTKVLARSYKSRRGRESETSS